MKNVLSIVVIFGVMIFMSGCRGESTGTYYPDNKEMEKNLRNAGYTVEVSTKLDDNYEGTCLYAKNDEEYLVFYWLENAEAVEYYTSKIEEKYFAYDRLVSIEDDSKFGSLVFCGTESAIDKSGIRIIDVKVDVKI